MGMIAATAQTQSFVFVLQGHTGSQQPSCKPKREGPGLHHSEGFDSLTQGFTAGQHSHWGHESLIITTTDCCPLPVMQRPWNASGRSTHSTCRQALHRHGQAVPCSNLSRQMLTSRCAQHTSHQALVTRHSAGLQSVLAAGWAQGSRLWPGSPLRRQAAQNQPCTAEGVCCCSHGRDRPQHSSPALQCRPGAAPPPTAS